MFSRKSVSGAFLVIFLFSWFAGNAVATPAQDERLEVKASETEQLKVLLERQKVNAVLTDGTRIKGKVKEVRSGVLVINVEQPEGAAGLAKGEQSLATDRFNTFEMKSYKGKKRGILAATLGFAGLALGVGINATEAESLGGEGSRTAAGIAVMVATTVGGAAVGYALGRNLDKKSLTIVITK